jgi:hypothetical protein
MSYADYQEHFDRMVQELSTRYAAMPTGELVRLLEEKRYDPFYQLWHALHGRVTPGQVNHLLQAVLASDEDYLHRYHCAAAYIAINGLTGYEPVQLSARETQPVAENLQAAFAEVEAARRAHETDAGPRPRAG